MIKARTIAVALLLASTVGASACRTADRSTGSHAATSDALVQRERDWARAMREHDAAALDQILAAEFRLTFVDAADGPPGVPEVTRAQWLENLQGMTFGPVTMTNQRVTMHGANVAVVRMRMKLEEWRFGPHLIPPDYDLTDVWVKRDGTWQAVNRISEPVAVTAGETR